MRTGHECPSGTHGCNYLCTPQCQLITVNEIYSWHVHLQSITIYNKRCSKEISAVQVQKCYVHFGFHTFHNRHQPQKLPQAIYPRYPLMWPIYMTDPWVTFCIWFTWQGYIFYMNHDYWTIRNKLQGNWEQNTKHFYVSHWRISFANVISPGKMY